LAGKVETISGQTLSSCYQCGKCSAGCPLEHAMNILPHQVIRDLQLGREEQALAAGAIWLCAACHTCAARCPRGVDLSRIMEALRVIQMRRGLGPPDQSALPGDVPQQLLVSFLRKYVG
jgi:heterodisulfide reductase subunit C